MHLLRSDRKRFMFNIRTCSVFQDLVAYTIKTKLL